MKGSQRRHEKAKVRRAISQFKREVVFNTDLYSCVYCGSRGPLTLDHVIPVSTCTSVYHHRVINHEANLLTACVKCNEDRGHNVHRVMRYGRFIKNPMLLNEYRPLASNRLEVLASWWEAP